MKKLFLIFLIPFFIIGCKSGYYFKVQPIEKVDEYIENPLIYILPKTKIIIVVQVDKIIENKAPFADYTEKYLGSLKNIIKENKTYWEINKVQFFTVPEVDTSQIYVINSNVANLTDYINLTKEGFLVSFNGSSDFSKDLNIPEQTQIQKETGISELSFAQIAIDKTFKEIYDTIYKTEHYDTIFKLVPIIRKNVIKKPLEEQAKELAEEIFTLRDDRAALLVGEGDSEYLPDGQALEIMLKGIDKLEKEYLSMFVGRRDTISFHYIFSFIPEQKTKRFQTILFKFSTNKGVLPAESLNGKPVILEIEINENTEKIQEFYFKQQLFKSYQKGKKENNGLYYRLPEKAKVKLKYENTLLGQKDIYIAQFGTIVQIPERILLQKDIKIEFYPDLGTLKSITKIKQNANR